MHPSLNWIEHLTTDQKVAGSNPAGCTRYKEETMEQSRNEKCNCGSGKKYKNCCMQSSGESFLKKNGIRVLIFSALLLLAGNAIYSISDKEPIPDDWEWCEDCRAYKPPGHNKNKDN